jgi:hypothetical protein
VPTAAKAIRTSPKGEARRWWAKVAYNGQDRPLALAALQSSGIPLRPVDGAKDLLSAMARGDALIKGAARLVVPRRKGRSQNTRYHRLLQWRLVMGYAGFEVFAKACLRKRENDGLGTDDFERLIADCRFPPIALTQPILNAETSRWLSRQGDSDPIDILSNFLRLGRTHRDFLHEWFKGHAIETHLEAIHLAKILRHATAHGVLSPAKCHGLGLTDALKMLPKTIDEIRVAVINRLYACRE